MKELGNLAVVCARRPDVLMQIYDGTVSVHMGAATSGRPYTAPGIMTRKSAALSMS